MKWINSIVVDDEYLNRELITSLIESADINFKVIAKASNIDMAFDLIKEHKPDVIFLDIKMPNGSGFDLLRRFEKYDFEVVFITGYDEYAIQAFDFNALDYILKPIDSDKLIRTLKKVIDRLNDKVLIKFDFKELIDSYNVESNEINKIPIHANNKVFLLNVNDIISLTTVNGYSIFKTINNEEWVSSKQFSSFEFIFDSNIFFCKINKGIYININFIKSYSKGKFCEVTMKDSSIYGISRRKKAEILKILDEHQLLY
jgi:two-component system LytT family response regulator